MEKQQQSTNQFVSWFRNSSPYIHACRGKTFVIAFGGELLNNQKFSSLVQDIALLNSLGIRLVLVHGLRPQIEQRLHDRGASSQYFNGIRITDDSALTCAQDASGAARIKIESLLSMGLANTPMSGSEIKIVSGNFITACPLGVIDGTDYQHTGKVRRINHTGIQQCLTDNAIILLSPIGYSPTGEFFNLTALEVATSTAIALQADKLILLTGPEGLRQGDKRLARELTLAEAEKTSGAGQGSPETVTTPLQQACHACNLGVRRSHILDQDVDGAILLELFTRDGCGTMISTDHYEDIRHATIDDVGGILKLITPLEEKKVLVKRSREALEIEIDQYIVVERDGMTIACAALYPFPAENIGEISCLAVHIDYQGAGYGRKLLSYLETQGQKSGLQQLFVLTTQASHWFQEWGFLETELEALPVQRRFLYNYQRKSKILVKRLH